MLLARLVRFPLTAKAVALATATVLGLASCGTVSAAQESSQQSAARASRVPSSASPTPTQSAVMDDARFWSIIASTRASRSTSQRAELLQGRLKQLPPAQIAEFDRHLTAAVNSIGQPRHLGAAEIMMGFTSKTAFADFRAWIVAQGQGVHARFRDDPDSLVDVGLDREGELVAGEMVAFAPDKVYREVTGRNLVDDFPDARPPEGLGSTMNGPSYAQLARDLPRLAAAYLPSPVPEGNAFADGPRGINLRR